MKGWIGADWIRESWMGRESLGWMGAGLTALVHLEGWKTEVHLVMGLMALVHLEEGWVTLVRWEAGSKALVR